MDTSVLEITATDQLRGICTTLLQSSHVILPVREPNVPVPFNRGTTPIPAAGPEHPTLPSKGDLGAGPTNCLMVAHVHGQDTHSQSRSWIHIQTLKLGNDTRPSWDFSSFKSLFSPQHSDSIFLVSLQTRTFAHT